jgi:hypothetical protein
MAEAASITAGLRAANVIHPRCNRIPVQLAMKEGILAAGISEKSRQDVFR